MYKIYVIKINDKYLVIPKTVSSVNLYIDGNEYFDVTKDEGIVFDTKPKLIKIITTRTIIDKYINIDDDNDIISVEEYNNIVEELTRNAIYDMDNYEYIFNNIDEEYEYKKFIKKYKEINKIVKELTDVDIVYINKLGITDYEPYIIPIRKALDDCNNVDLDRISLYKYCPNKTDMLEEVAHKHGFVKASSINKHDKKPKYYYEQSSSFEYLKINDRYVKNYHKMPQFRAVIGTFEECKKSYDEDFKRLNDIFEYEKNLIDSIDKEVVNVATIIKELENLKILTYKLDVKVASDIKPYELEIKINKIIKKLMKGE